MTELKASIIIRAIDRTTAPMRRVTDNFARLRASWKQTDKLLKTAANMRQAAAGVNSFAIKARQAVAGPISAFEEFQEAVAELKGVSGLAGAPLKALSDEAIRLGTSIGEFDPTGAVRGMTELRRAGYSSSDIFATLPSLLDLSTTAGIELAQATKITTGIMGGFGLQATEANRVVDVLSATANNSKTTIETLGETFGYLAPIARAAGLSLEQTSVLAGALGNSSIDASRAGTALNATLLRFAGARRGPGSKILGNMGVELDTIVDGIKKTRDPLLVFADIGKKIAHLSKREQLGVLGRIFGSDAAPGAAILATAMKDVRTTTLQAAVAVADANDVTARMAKDFRDTGRNETKQLTSALNTLGVVVGEQLAPAISWLKMTLKSMIESITEWTRKNPTLTRTLGIVAVAVAGLSTALAGFMFTLVAATTALGVMNLAMGGSQTGAQLMGSAIKWVSSGITKALPSLAIWNSSWWSSAIAINSALWPILAIVAAIAGVVLVVKYWDKLVAIWERFKNASIATKAVLVTLAAPFIAMFAPILAVANLIKQITAGAGSMKEVFSDIWDVLVWPLEQVVSLLEKVDAVVSKISIPAPLKSFLEMPAKLLAAPLPHVGGAATAVAGAATRIGREAAYVATGNQQVLEAGDLGGTAQQVGGKIVVQVESDVQARVASVSQRGPVGIEADTGYMAGLPY